MYRSEHNEIIPSEWCFIECDLGTKETHFGVKRGWVAPAFSLGEAKKTVEAVALVAMPHHYGKEITVIQKIKKDVPERIRGLTIGAGWGGFIPPSRVLVRYPRSVTISSTNI